jgi:hypothetical protein
MEHDRRFQANCESVRLGDLVSYPDSPENYAMQEAKAASLAIGPPDIRKSLVRSRENAMREIERCDRLLALLDNNPDTTEILQLLGNGGRY